jgi:hypothetical protein
MQQTKQLVLKIYTTQDLYELVQATKHRDVA